MNYIIVIVIGFITGAFINVYSQNDKFETALFKKIHEYFYRKIHYLVVEIGMPALLLYVYLVTRSIGDFVKYGLLLAILSSATVVDIKYKSISNKLIIFALSIGILITVLSLKSSIIKDSLLTLVITIVGLAIIYFASRGGIGLGDVKLVASISLFLGLSGVVSIFCVSVILSGITSLILLLFRVLKRKATIPFSPFLLASFIILVSYL